MKKIEIVLPDRLVEAIETSGLEADEIIAQALDSYLLFRKNFGNLKTWKLVIEGKIISLQDQVDSMRTHLTSDIGTFFDSDLADRNKGNKSPLALPSEGNSVESIHVHKPKIQSGKKGKPKKPSKEEVDVDINF